MISRTPYGTPPDDFTEDQKVAYEAGWVACLNANKVKPKATPSPYDCGSNPTKDYPGE